MFVFQLEPLCLVIAYSFIMVLQMKELQQLKGIGEILSRRLIEASYDTIAKVAAAEEKGLENIAGMNPRKRRAVVNQARTMVRETGKSQHSWTRNSSDRQ